MNENRPDHQVPQEPSESIEVSDVGRTEFVANSTAADQQSEFSTNSATIGGSGRAGIPATMWLEIGLIFLLFAGLSGQSPPDTNETHYLTKAKHFWNPDWCAGDIFLESSNAHLLFYVTFGWLTKWFSLATCAWIGRCLTWGLMATAWWWMSWRWLPMRWMAPLSAMVFLLLNMRFHLAGEWVVGGFEAKCIAYVFVLVALGELWAENWKRVWPWLGAGAAFHVLVGGWAMLAAGMCWLVAQWSIAGPSAEQSLARWWIAIRQQLVPVLAGVALAMIGALPPLLADGSASPQQTAEANQIYVYQRISHHLNFSAFATYRVACFVVMVAGWLATMKYCRSKWPHQKQFQRLYQFGLASLLISMVGLVLSGLAETTPERKIWAASLLRFYWFRLSDFAIPVTMALTLTWVVGRFLRDDSRIRQRVCAGFFIVLMMFATIVIDYQRFQDPRPLGDRNYLPTYDDNTTRTLQTFDNWKKVCHWVRDNTPAHATFITPFEQQSFKWYAGRAEVVNWKDIPQDAAGILEWQARVNMLLLPQKNYDAGLMAYSDVQLQQMAERFGAEYLLLPQRQVDISPVPTDLVQVYPENSNQKATYVVFRVK